VGIRADKAKMHETGNHDADTAPNAPFVDSYLLYLLAASSEKASAQVHAHVRKQGLRVPEWRVLACLVDHPSMMVTRLAELSLMEQSRMTRIVEKMAERGLVQRQSDTEDRRRVHVSLTETGRDLAERLVCDARAHEKQMLADLEDTDAALIKPMLTALLQQLR
jgi:DNA-binding MarR family transcriptional regulator